MPIRYFLRPNTLVTSDDDYLATVQSVAVVNDDAVIEAMVNRGTTLTRADLLAAVHLYQETITTLLLEGKAVNTTLVQYGASIRGTFASHDERFNASKHEIHPTVKPSRRLRQAMVRAKTERIEAHTRTPRITSVYNQADDSTNERLTSGQMVHISGRRLKFDPDDDRQGIFFLPADGSPVKAGQVVINRNNELICLIPALPVGSCVVEVRTRLDQSLRHGRSVPLQITQ